MKQLDMQIREKRNILREKYGGMMSLKQLTAELGMKDTRPAKAWAAENGLGNRVGRYVKYESDMVARQIVLTRGMC